MADEELQRLAREADAQPSDEAVARRYDQGLRRAGRDRDLRARFQFKLLCPLRFEDLPPTADPLVRACGRCGRDVSFVASPVDLAEQVAQGRCVAFERKVLGDVVDRVAHDARNHSARVEGSPCLVPTDLPFIDLDAFTPPREALSLVPSTTAREYRFVPVEYRRKGGRLRIAIAQWQPNLADDLRFMINVSVDFALALPDAVDRALTRVYPPEEEPRYLMGDVFEV
jgi:hypothetical protein